MSSLKKSSIIVWKVAGLFIKPKNITRGSKSPQFSQKAAFHLSPSFNMHLVLSSMDIQLHEILGLGFGDVAEDVWDQREGVGILHSHCVELSVILDQVWAFILLLDEENQGCHG